MFGHIPEPVMSSLSVDLLLEYTHTTNGDTGHRYQFHTLGLDSNKLTDGISGEQPRVGCC